MKSWQSKVSLLLVLAAGSTGLTSCKLFGGGEYSSQLEVETEVPESLERGKASEGPATKDAAYVSANTGVPSDSNLIDLPELPSTAPIVPTTASTTTGGASMTGMPPSGYDRVDIPKPDFAAINMESGRSRPPAEMISLGPAGSQPRMALNSDPAGQAYSSKVTEEKMEPAVPVPTEAELAAAPEATKEAPALAASKPGVPLLHSGTRLADYYQNLHSSVLNNKVVENATASGAPADSAPGLDPGAPGGDLPPPPASAEELNVPPPPPGGEETAPPAPPQ